MKKSVPALISIYRDFAYIEFLGKNFFIDPEDIKRSAKRSIDRYFGIKSKRERSHEEPVRF